MKNNYFISIIVFILFVVLTISFFAIIFSLNNLKNKFTGKASSSQYGVINITIISVLDINLSRDTINWGNGEVNSSESNCTLFTNGDNPGTVLRGNWSEEGVYGLVLENQGNMLCSISIKSEKNAEDFFSSGSSSNQEYKINISNKLPGSCVGLSDNGHNNIWSDIPKNPDEGIFCNSFNFLPGKNSLFLDILFTIPSDAQNIGNQTDTITITAIPVD